MSRLLIWIVKLTAIIPNWFYYRRKTYYVNSNQKRKIKGAAIIVSNHRDIMDFPLYMFTFFGRTLRTLTAEVLYNLNRFMNWFLKKLGCIRVNRDAYDFGFMNETIDILDKGGVALVFPEGRIPEKDEIGQIPFKPSFVYIALKTGAPIIPCFTNGSYGKKERAKVVIGEKIYLHELMDENKSEAENIDYLCKYVKDYIYKLGERINETK